ncbi:hypothetical protein LPJGGPFB_04947 [Ensifer adhaerens]|uniref:DUF2798 domain-containing protein n=1 Tax=Ensifer adhaerens TaxID=106592 RepID=UPI001569E815|nr:DUF2798 domain-containing protein [Ensifer adhaerens]NRP21688.1 hypothetical protein [Ensifer adhaerens]
MDIHLKRRIAFALSMGVVTTGIISFTLLALNLGFSNGFVLTWLRSWGIGYVIVIPVILLIGPRLQAQVDRLVTEPTLQGGN